jgi:NADH-quinone oxidoreductase subunit C
VSAAEVARSLAERLGGGVEVISQEGAETRLRSRRDCLRDTVAALFEDGYRLFVDYMAVDYPMRTERFEVVLQLARREEPERVFVHVGVPEEDPVLPTLSDLVPGANWCEREMYDMFGLSFQGHPNLRRIYLPDDWEGHPLRKDYPVRGTRPLPLILHEPERG